MRQVKAMISCPICGSTGYKEGYQCRRLGQVVCAACCYACEYGWKNPIWGWQCKYGVAEAEKQKKELGEIRGKIYELGKEQAYLYRRGNWRKADSLEWEIANLKKELVGLNDA